MSIVGYYEGDRSELLASYALSLLGFCVPVPRQFDRFLVDLFVNVLETNESVHRATSNTCGLQIKSQKKAIRIRGRDGKDAFFRTGTPFFVALVNKKQQKLSIYTTLPRLMFAWTPGEVDVDLVFTSSSWPKLSGAGTPQIPLGDPIVSVEIAKLDSPDRTVSDAERAKLRTLIPWIMLERVAISWRLDQLPFLLMPEKIATNIAFEWKDLQCHVISHPSVAAPAAMSVTKTIEFYKDHVIDILAAMDQTPLDEATKKNLQTLAENLVAVGNMIKEELGGNRGSISGETETG